MTVPLNILLAGDDQNDCRFFDRALKELSIPSTLKMVMDGEELMQLLTDESVEIPDVLFPVVILSASNTSEKIILHFKIGARVYTPKPKYFSQLKQVSPRASDIHRRDRYQ